MKAGMKPRRAIAAGQDVAKVDRASVVRDFDSDSGILKFVLSSV